MVLYSEDNAEIVVNNRGEMTGSAVTGPAEKEWVDFQPRIESNAGSIE